ncbi:FAD-binding protein, partial [Actinomadura adrarensis]
AYNAACPPSDGFDHTAPDGLATEGLVPPKSNWSRPIEQGPFVAYPIMAANVFSFGGLRTTSAAEVVDRDGRPMKGLYAAGELTGLYYSNYTGSTSVLRGATFGRIAGTNAAALKAEA